MHCCLVSQEYPPDTNHGGIGTQTRAKAVGLTRLGHDVTVVSTSSDGQYRRTSSDGVDVVRLAGWNPRMPVVTEPVRWLQRSMDVAAAVQDLHETLPFDVIDVPEYGAEGYVLLLNRSTGAVDVPVVVHLHGSTRLLADHIGWPAPGSDLLEVACHMETTCIRLADRVLASSELSARAAVLDRPNADPIEIFHTGVDTDQFHPGAPSTSPTIVCVGRFAPSKGTDVLVRACIEVSRRHPALRLVLVGRGDDAFVDSLVSEARAAGRPDMLEIRQPVAHAELPELLRRAAVYASPSTFEAGPGMTFLEAMACGIPVVGPAGTGVSEVVTDGRVGLLVEPTLEPVAAALSSLLDDPERRGQLGQNARAEAVARFSTARAIARLEKIYASVIG
jgi:glycosyltransferase involved in cell wall biosynthesis